MCTNGVCSVTCATGQTNCSGVCRNLSSDNANCGACGRACSTGQACVSGVCVGQGTLRFTLTWDTAGDMDLHVQPPCGTSIYYGNNLLTGGTGNDNLDGGAGTDTAIYTGNWTAYNLATNAGVTTLTGNGETDTLTNIENLHFNGLQLLPCPRERLLETARDSLGGSPCPSRAQPSSD